MSKSAPTTPGRSVSFRDASISRNPGGMPPPPFGSPERLLPGAENNLQLMLLSSPAESKPFRPTSILLDYSPSEPVFDAPLEDAFLLEGSAYSVDALVNAIAADPMKSAIATMGMTQLCMSSEYAESQIKTYQGAIQDKSDRMEYLNGQSPQLKAARDAALEVSSCFVLSRCSQKIENTSFNSNILSFSHF